MLEIEAIAKQEKEIIDKAKFLHIFYHDEKPLSDCVRQAIYETLHLPDVAFLSVFNITKNDYIQTICEKINN